LCRAKFVEIEEAVLLAIGWSDEMSLGVGFLSINLACCLWDPALWYHAALTHLPSPQPDGVILRVCVQFA